MSKRSFITSITPLPRTLSRETAVELLHDHHSMIELNPLVIRHVPTDPPQNASQDEAENATWYEITDKINYLPGGAMKSEVSYKACFYNLPRGLQTHVFAPAGLDMKSKWLVCGNMPGEPREPVDLGIDAPREGLYIREDVEMRCNVFLQSFVKRNLKKSHQVVIDKIIDLAGKTETKLDYAMQRPGLPSTNLSMENATIFSRAPSVLSQMASVPSSFTSEGPQRPGHQQPIIHQSYPPHCACEGTTHDLSCSFFHSDDLHSSTPNLSLQTQHIKPFYAMTIPSATSSCYSQPSSPFAVPQQTVAFPELYGSSSRDQCLCTGALHEQSCASYPGLRPSTGQSHQQRSASAGPVRGAASTIPAQLTAGPPPRPHVAVGSGSIVRPQLYGEQAELPADARTPTPEEWPLRNLMPASLQGRGNISHSAA